MEWWKKFKAWLEEGPSIILLFPAVITAALLLTQLSKVFELPEKVQHLILLNTSDAAGKLTSDEIAKTFRVAPGVTWAAVGIAVIAIAFALVWVAYWSKLRDAKAGMRQQAEKLALASKAAEDKFAAVSKAMEDARTEREVILAAAATERRELQAVLEQERERLIAEQEKERRSAALQMRALEDFLEDTNKNAERIKDLLKKLNEHVIEVIEDSTTLTIEGDGTAVVETVRRIRARGGPLYFVAIDTYGGQRLLSFRDIQFSASWVNAEGDERMAWLPVINRETSKGVFIFFLPGVMAGREATYRYLYRWPGTFKPLVDGTDDYYEVTAISSVPLTRLKFRIDVSIPKVSVTHQGGGQHVPDAETPNELNYRVYCHTLHNLQALEKATFTLDKR